MQRKNIFLSTLALASLFSVNTGFAMEQQEKGLALEKNVMIGLGMAAGGRTVSYFAHRGSGWSKNTCLSLGLGTALTTSYAMQPKDATLQDFAGQCALYVIASALSLYFIPVEEKPEKNVSERKETPGERSDKRHHRDLSVPSLLDSRYNR